MAENETFLDEATKSQLAGVFNQFQSKVVVKGYYNDQPMSGALDTFMKEMIEVSDKLIYEVHEDANEEIEVPALSICKESGEDAGIYFHGIPGGHEFNSFILALYNVAGPGKQIEQAQVDRIAGLGSHTIKIIASLSCTMCPVSVQAAQKIASLSDRVTAHMFDVAYSPTYVEKYKIENVPCIIIDDSKVVFGLHDMDALLGALE